MKKIIVEEATANKMVEAYIKDRMSLARMAVKFMLDSRTIKNQLVRRGVLLRLPGFPPSVHQHGDKNPNWKGGKRSYIHRTAEATLLKANVDVYTCMQCSYEGLECLQLHHIDGDNHNNSIENLEVLCITCHNSGASYAKHSRKRGLDGRWME